LDHQPQVRSRRSRSVPSLPTIRTANSGASHHPNEPFATGYERAACLAHVQLPVADAMFDSVDVRLGACILFPDRPSRAVWRCGVLASCGPGVRLRRGNASARSPVTPCQAIGHTAGARSLDVHRHLLERIRRSISATEAWPSTQPDNEESCQCLLTAGGSTSVTILHRATATKLWAILRRQPSDYVLLGSNWLHDARLVES